MKVKFPFALGLFAALTNFVPYVGQVLGGALPTLITLGQYESIGDALIVAVGLPRRSSASRATS